MTMSDQRTSTRVLIIEDDPAIGSLFARILSPSGYDCCVVQDGLAGIEAFAAAADAPFSIAIIDYSMPGIVGSEVARQIRASDPGVSLILTSGFGRRDAVCGDDGTIDAFLQKPFTRQGVLQTVDQALESRKQFTA